MPDISRRNRTFEVWIDVGVPGKSPHTETVEVPAGEDADEVCAEVLDTMIGSHLDTGWVQKRGRP
jgi:hypothetical protein